MSNTKENAKITISEVEESGMKKIKFKDNEGDAGFDIVTSVYAGGSVKWTADTKSGIKKIKSIEFNTKEKIFVDKPSPSGDKTIFTAQVKKGVSGTFHYKVNCVLSDDSEYKANLVGADQGPALKIDPPGNE